MSAEWKTSIKVMVACFVIALAVLALGSLYASVGAEQRANATLASDRDTYKRAGAAYAKREAELESAIGAAKERATLAESATRSAQSEFDRYKRGVVGRDNAVREQLDTCIASLNDSGDDIERCLELADLCISIDRLVEPSAYR